MKEENKGGKVRMRKVSALIKRSPRPIDHIVRCYSPIGVYPNSILASVGEAYYKFTLLPNFE